MENILANLVQEELGVKDKKTNTKTPSKEEIESNFLNEGVKLNKDLGKLGSIITPTTTSVGQTGFGVQNSKYDTANIPLTSIIEGQLEPIRAGRQGAVAKFGNALVGGIASGAVGVGENFSVLADAIGQKLGVMEDFEKSLLTENLQLAKDWVNEQTPIYRKNRANTFDWSDSGFYFELLKGAVDSAVAFGFAGAGYAGIMRNLASMMGKGTLMGHRLNVLTRFAGSKIGQPNIAADLTTFGAATLSNYGEGTIMGLETYETEKEKLLIVGERTLRNQRAAELGISPQDVELTEDDRFQIEADAVDGAGGAGHMMRNLNHILIFGNLAQMNSIAGLRRWISGGGSTVSRNMQSKAFSPKQWGFWKNQAIGAPLEAAEEIGQNVIQMESRYQSDLDAINKGFKFNDDELESMSDNLGNRLLEFATSDQALLEGLMGFVSGPIQYGITQAPFQSGAVKESSKRYATQQAIIGKNADFIANKLRQTAGAEQLAEQFEEYRDQVLGRNLSETTPEENEADAKRFQELLENTPLDTLIEENLFNGTTEDLEAQLQEKAQKTPTTPEEEMDIEFAQKALGRLNELEQRFVSYNKYVNGAEIFAADLRGKRIQEIANQLEESFGNREKEMTIEIQNALENEYKSLLGDAYDGELVDLNKNFELVKLDKEGKPGKKREVNSVSDIVKGIKDGYELYSNKFSDRVLGQVDVVNKALNNALLLDTAKDIIGKNRTFVNEAKTLDYQSLYADYVDAMASRDENNIHDMGLVKNNLEELLKNKKFTPTKKDANGIDIQPFSQLKTSITEQIKDLDKKIKYVESNANNLAEEEKNKIKSESKKKADDAKKGIPVNPAEAMEGKAAKTKTIQFKQKLYPPLNPALTKELIDDLLKNPFGKRSSAVANALWTNPDTGEGEVIHTYRVTAQGEGEISFPSNPDKFFIFMDEETNRYIPSAKEFLKESAEENPTQKTEYVVGDELTYKGEKGFKVAKVLPDGKLQIKKGSNTITVDPTTLEDKPRSSTAKGTSATTKESTGPSNQVDNKKSTTKASNKKKVDFQNLEPIATDNSTSQESMQKDLGRTKDFEANNPKTVDILETSIDPETGEFRYESANVKALDFNFTEAREDAYSEFMRNKHDKEGTVLNMSVDTSNAGANLFKSKAGQVNEAIKIFNKLKQSGAKSLKDWNKFITGEEYDTLINYLPIKFQVDGKPEIESYIPVTQSSKIKLAEKKLREDTIEGQLSGTPVQRQIKGQGPGALNTIAPSKVIDSVGDVDTAVLHVSVGGALVALNEVDEDMFDGTLVTFTDGQGNEVGWDGVFTLAVTDMAGKKFPVKLNTLNHSSESATVVVEMLREAVNAKFKTQKGDVDNNIIKRSLQEIAPSAYKWIENNLPSMLEVYGKKITLGQALDDMVYYGDRTKGTYGHLSFANGVISIGGEGSTDFNLNGKPLQFSYNDLANNPDMFASLVEFIEQVKPFNVNAAKLKNLNQAQRVAYKNHVFSNYMETTVDLSNPFIKVTGANPTGGQVQRFERAHLYISSLPIGDTAKQAPFKSEAKPAVPSKTETNKLKPKFDTKAWTKSKVLSDGTSAEVMHENSFDSVEEFSAFVNERNKIKAEVSYEAYKEMMPWADNLGSYEDFLNQKAATNLGIDIYKGKGVKPNAKPIAKVNTTSNIKPAVPSKPAVVNTVSYIPKGKAKQTYTISGKQIFNFKGEEVFSKPSSDRNKIFANYQVKNKNAVVVTHAGKDYVVNKKGSIMSVATGKIMEWADNNKNRVSILSDVKVTSLNINTPVLDNKKKEPNLSKKKIEAMQEEKKKEIDKCPTGKSTVAPSKKSLGSILNKKRR